MPRKYRSQSNRWPGDSFTLIAHGSIARFPSKNRLFLSNFFNFHHSLLDCCASICPQHETFRENIAFPKLLAPFVIACPPLTPNVRKRAATNCIFVVVA
jgi:hypothetical protein